MNTRDSYETHITLQIDPANAESPAAWAAAKDLKWTHIELAVGDAASQPMVTFWGSGNVASQIERAHGICREIRTLGCEVLRVKVEAAVTNSNIPQHKRHTLSDRYFEHHIKVVLAPNRISTLESIAQTQKSQLSQNARRQRDDGRYERFVTQRVYHAGLPAAAAMLKPLLSALTDASFEIAEVEQEYVWHDSNVTLDRGWIDATGEIPCG